MQQQHGTCLSVERVAAGAIAGGIVAAVAVYLLAWRVGIHGFRLIVTGLGVSAMLAAANLRMIRQADQTPLLLLDEPTTFLDIAHQIELLDLCHDLNRRGGRTLVAVLHDLNQACRHASHMIAMRDGAIVAEGKPSDRVTAEMVERVFGLSAVIIEDPVCGTPLVVPRRRQEMVSSAALSA